MGPSSTPCAPPLSLHLELVAKHLCTSSCNPAQRFSLPCHLSTDASRDQPRLAGALGHPSALVAGLGKDLLYFWGGKDYTFRDPFYTLLLLLGLDTLVRHLAKSTWLVLEGGEA